MKQKNVLWIVADHQAAGSWSRTERRRHGGQLMSGIRPEVALDCVSDLLAGREPGIR